MAKKQFFSFDTFFCLSGISLGLSVVIYGLIGTFLILFIPDSSILKSDLFSGMQLNGALTHVFGALGFTAVFLKMYRLTFWISLVVCIFVLLNAIDRFIPGGFARDSLGSNIVLIFGHSTKSLSLVASGSLFLGMLVLILLSTLRKWKYTPLVASFLLAAGLALLLFGLLGHLTGYKTAYQWLGEFQTGLVSAFIEALGGNILILAIALLVREQHQHNLLWIPFPISFGFFLATLVVYFTLRSEPLDVIEDRSEVQMHEIVSSLHQYNKIVLGYTLITGIGASIILGLLTWSYLRSRQFQQQSDFIHERLQKLIGSLNEGILSLNNHGVITFASESVFNLTGFYPEECIDYKPDEILFLPGTIPYQDVIQKKIHIDSQEGLFYTKTKKTFLALVSCYPVIELEEIVGAVLVFRDITEKKLIQQLSVENKELQEFTYIVSHDLQAPVRHILSFIDLLSQKKEIQNDPENQRWMNYITVAGKRIKNLIDDLLRYSRVTSKHLTLKKVDLNQTLKQIVEYFENDLKRIDGQVHVSNLPTIMADDSSMLQLFQNLIQNAIKFKKPDTFLEIQIGFEDKSNEWIFYCRDNGIGIDASNFNKLFQIFFRVQQDSKIDGSGIGLAIVQKIVQRFGGRIWVESELGKGTTFYFSIKKIIPEQEAHDTAK